MRAEIVVPWRSDREVARLTGEIQALARRIAEQNADACVEAGRRLDAVRNRIGGAAWREWIAHTLAFEIGTARNYIKLALWARSEPDEYARLRALGPAKLYVIMALDARTRRALAMGRTLALPDGRRKSIAIMTTAELEQHLGLATELGRKRPIGELVQRVRRSVASLGAWATELGKRSRDVDPKTAKQLHDAIAEVLAALDDALGV